MAETFRSIRGKDKLVDDNNFIYNEKQRNVDGTIKYWKCEVRECNARVHTRGDRIIKYIGVHDHLSSAVKPKIKRVLGAIKDTAISSAKPSRSLIAAAVGSLTESELPELPPTSHVCRSIRYWRQSTASFPANPMSRVGFDIPERFRLLEKGDIFLQFDSGKEDVNRILLFSSEKGLDDLYSINNWAGDGTFKCCPSIFFQLYVLNVQIGSSTEALGSPTK
ncbi:hypothetical protein J437_LFUL010686 [Ladona fulva]|uniref:FLYWCH-type domain-containing protein n=1 Tax=Ladona fulva TaxID=123851 RepID=A0A8K0K9U7_LADFU|nr:hypothetical protein J437_LFUL010686 [Ladona fulva]